MYSRAPRKGLEITGGTPNSIGPGSYDVVKDSVIEENSAPFLSSGEKKFSLVPRGVAELPGPFEYDPDATPVLRRVIGGKTLQNLEERGRITSSCSPGPGAYEHDVKWIEVDRPQWRMVDVTYNNLGVASSVPYGGNVWGYYDGFFGELHLTPGPDLDRTLGPAFYKQEHVEPLATRKYKGNFWSRMKSERSQKDSEGPAPGDYHLPRLFDESREEAEENKDGKQKELPKVSRYLDIVIARAVKENAPGPGWYEMKSAFDPQEKDALVFPRCAFMVTGERFKSKQKATPGPGDYDDLRSCVESAKKITSYKNIPFLNGAARFPRSVLSEVPGPGKYYIKSFVEENQQRVSSPAPFGCSAIRFRKTRASTAPPTRNIPCTPKPVEKKVLPKRKFFLVKPRRIGKEEDKGTPPPGKYDVMSSFSKTQNKKSHHIPFLGGDPPPNPSPFMVSSTRFTKKSEGIPGPGEYNVASEKRLYKLYNGPLAERFQCKADDGIPGPGSYTVHPLYGQSMLRRTYNVTMNNPVPAITKACVQKEREAKAKEANREFEIPALQIWRGQ